MKEYGVDESEQSEVYREFKTGDYGCTPKDFDLFMAYGVHGNEISSILNLEKSTVSRHISSLESQKLIESQKAIGDKRRNILRGDGCRGN